MKALVTGASGFVGQHLMRYLAETGNETDGIGQDVSGSAISCYQLNMLNDRDVADFNFKPYNAIFHLAGLAAVGSSFSNPRKYIDSNAGMEINLFESMLMQKSNPRILIISTGNIYDPTRLPLTEDYSINPSNPYAISKITQELLGQYYGRLGFEVIIARPFNHCGPGQAEGFIVADLAKQIAMAEKSGHDKIRVGDLSSKRDYTDVRDIVRGYAAIMEKGKPGEVYNVCSGHPRSGQEILEGLLAHSKARLMVEKDPALIRPSEIKEIYGSYDKLKQDTGWEPTIPFSQTLGDVLDDWRARLG